MLHQRVEHSECQPLQQPNLGVADAEVALHGSHQQAEDLAVHIRKHVDRSQRDDDVPGIAGGRGRGLGLGFDLV